MSDDVKELILSLIGLIFVVLACWSLGSDKPWMFLVFIFSGILISTILALIFHWDDPGSLYYHPLD